MTILLVEDHPDDALLVEEMLVDAAFDADVSVRATLAAAIEFLEKNAADVAILDLGLPDAADDAAIGEVRRHSPKLPVVVFTGNDDPDLALALVQKGASEVLVKGRTDLVQLVKAIRFAVERARVSERLHAAESEARQKGEQLQRLKAELAGLARLSKGESIPVSSSLFAAKPLCETVPEIFGRLSEAYEEALDLALDEQRFKVAHRSSTRLREIAAELGFLAARPQDVIEIHCRALRRRTGGAQREDAKVVHALRAEAQLTALSLMGHLAAYYRSNCQSLNLTDG